MLEAIGAGAVVRTKQNWLQIWVQSNERKTILEELRTLSVEKSTLLVGDKEYAMPLVKNAGMRMLANMAFGLMEASN